MRLRFLLVMVLSSVFLLPAAPVLSDDEDWQEYLAWFPEEGSPEAEVTALILKVRDEIEANPDQPIPEYLVPNLMEYARGKADTDWARYPLLKRKLLLMLDKWRRAAELDRQHTINIAVTEDNSAMFSVTTHPDERDPDVVAEKVHDACGDRPCEILALMGKAVPQQAGSRSDASAPGSDYEMLVNLQRAAEDSGKFPEYLDKLRETGLPFNARKITFGERAHLRLFGNKMPFADTHNAAVLTDDGGAGYATGHGSPAGAVKAATRHCSKKTKSPCAVVGVDNKVVNLPGIRKNYPQYMKVFGGAK